jgi:hypothetical protein
MKSIILFIGCCLISVAALAGYPCPPDSCNHVNGCVDGCYGSVAKK